MEKIRPGLRGVAERVARSINDTTLLGLGSGSTVAGLLEELSPLLAKKGVSVSGVPTSTQIEMVATKNGISIVPFMGSVDLVIDGADQVDSRLNLIKGGGGALLSEKVLMSSAKNVAVVAGEEKFAPKLCTGGVKVPVEVAPFARKSVKVKLSQLGGAPEERLLPKGYPYFRSHRRARRPRGEGEEPPGGCGGGDLHHQTHHRVQGEGERKIRGSGMMMIEEPALSRLDPSRRARLERHRAV